MMTRLLIAAALCATAGTASTQDSTSSDWLKNPAMGNYKAYAEFKMGHYAAARHVWEVLAGLGNTDALFNLGILAEDGLGEAQDIAKAEALYAASASAGGVKAQYRLGLLYSSGGAIAEDVDKARHYFSLAAANGDAEAASRLRALNAPSEPASEFERAELLSSRGKHATALELYRGAADNGNLKALTRLAWMHEAGRGVERDLETAARLFLRAAEGGDAEAQYAIAVMYRTGQGQSKDRNQSLIWLKRAAEQRYPAAQAALAAEEAPR
jgi:hypothetical protein